MGEAIHTLASEKSDLQGLKLVHLLEEFYHKRPITKWYTEEERE